MKREFVVRKSSLIIFIFGLWGLWYVFFNASIVLRPMYQYLWPLAVILSVLLNIYSIYKNYSNLYIAYFLLVVACLLSLIISRDLSSSLDYIKRLVLAMLFAVAITSRNGTENIIFKIMECFCVVMLAISFSQYLLPNLYTGVVLPLCSQHDSWLVTSAIRSGEAVGFTNGTSQNGLFMAIGFVLFASKAACWKKNRFLSVLLSALFFGMAFATGKRSYSLICLVLLILIVHFASNNKKIANRVIVGTVVLIVCYFVFIFAARSIPALNNTIEKTIRLSNRGDVTNGRLIMYSDAWNEFKTHFLTGIGVDAAEKVLGGATHNSYLQWLVEFGFPLVLIPFVAVLYVPALKIKKILGLLKERKNDEKYQVLCPLMMTVMILFSGIVAVPFQWTNVFMIYMIMQLFLYKQLRKGRTYGQ